MTGVVINLPYIKILDLNGDPVAGAEVYFYEANSTTPIPTYTEPGFGVQQPHPVLTDAAGDLPLVYMDPDGGWYAMRVVYGDTDVTYDELQPGVTVPVGIAQGGTGSTTAPDALIALGAASQASVDANDARISANETKLAKPIPWPEDEITYAPTVTPDYALTEVRSVASVTGNMTVNAPTGLVKGQRGRFNAVNDGSSGHDITFDAAWGFNPDPQLDQEADAVNSIEFYVRSVDPSLDMFSWVVMAGPADNSVAPDVILAHQLNSGTNGGSLTSGAWRDRQLNTTLRNTGPMTAFADGKFTLDAGEYYINAHTIARNAGQCQNRLRNDDLATDLVYGMTLNTAAGSTDGAWAIPLSGTFTLDVPTTLLIQDRVQSGDATSGAGLASGFGTPEVYAKVDIWKV